MNGLQVAKVLNEEKFSGCIIMLTAYNIKEYIQKATESSVMGYLIKPPNGIYFSFKVKDNLQFTSQNEKISN